MQLWYALTCAYRLDMRDMMGLTWWIFMGSIQQMQLPQSLVLVLQPLCLLLCGTCTAASTVSAAHMAR